MHEKSVSDLTREIRERTCEILQQSSVALVNVTNLIHEVNEEMATKEQLQEFLRLHRLVGRVQDELTNATQVLLPKRSKSQLLLFSSTG